MPLLFVLLLLAGMPSHAEKVSNEQVIETFEGYLDAIVKGKLETLGQYIHPEELDTFKKLFVTIGESAAKQDNFEELAGILGVETLDELRMTPADELFTNLFNFITIAMPEFRQILKSAKTTMLGQVTEGEGEDELIHLVYRIEFEMNGAEIQSLDTATVKKAADGKYYLLFGEEIQGLIIALKNQFGGVN